MGLNVVFYKKSSDVASGVLRAGIVFTDPNMMEVANFYPLEAMRVVQSRFYKDELYVLVYTEGTSGTFLGMRFWGVYIFDRRGTLRASKIHEMEGTDVSFAVTDMYIIISYDNKFEFYNKDVFSLYKTVKSNKTYRINWNEFNRIFMQDVDTNSTIITYADDLEDKSKWYEVFFNLDIQVVRSAGRYGTYIIFDKLGNKIYRYRIEDQEMFPYIEVETSQMAVGITTDDMIRIYFTSSAEAGMSYLEYSPYEITENTGAELEIDVTGPSSIAIDVSQYQITDSDIKTGDYILIDDIIHPDNNGKYMVTAVNYNASGYVDSIELMYDGLIVQNSLKAFIINTNIRYGMLPFGNDVPFYVSDMAIDENNASVIFGDDGDLYRYKSINGLYPSMSNVLDGVYLGDRFVASNDSDIEYYFWPDLPSEVTSLQNAIHFRQIGIYAKASNSGDVYNQYMGRLFQTSIDSPVIFGVVGAASGGQSITIRSNRLGASKTENGIPINNLITGSADNKLGYYLLGESSNAYKILYFSKHSGYSEVASIAKPNFPYSIRPDRFGNVYYVVRGAHYDLYANNNIVSVITPPASWPAVDFYISGIDVVDNSIIVHSVFTANFGSGADSYCDVMYGQIIYSCSGVYISETSPVKIIELHDSSESDIHQIIGDVRTVNDFVGEYASIIYFRSHGPANAVLEVDSYGNFVSSGVAYTMATQTMSFADGFQDVTINYNNDILFSLRGISAAGRVVSINSALYSQSTISNPLFVVFFSDRDGWLVPVKTSEFWRRVVKKDVLEV